MATGRILRDMGKKESAGMRKNNKEGSKMSATHDDKKISGKVSEKGAGQAAGLGARSGAGLGADKSAGKASDKAFDESIRSANKATRKPMNGAAPKAANPKGIAAKMQRTASNFLDSARSAATASVKRAGFSPEVPATVSGAVSTKKASGASSASAANTTNSASGTNGRSSTNGASATNTANRASGTNATNKAHKTGAARRANRARRTATTNTSTTASATKSEPTIPAPGTALKGVNLAGWLLLESWVTPELFMGTGTLDAEQLASVLGEEAYNSLITKHRDHFITESDFKRIAARGFDLVRIPLPWYAFGPTGPLPGYHRGCVEYLDKAFEWAEKFGLKILLDIALLPGATLSSNGLTMSLALEKIPYEASIQVLAALARRYARSKAFLGIEPIDSPSIAHRQGLKITEGLAKSRLRSFYRDAYAAVRECAGENPVFVLSDAGEPDGWKSFMRFERYKNVWLDTHLYHFASTDAYQGPAAAQLLVQKSLNQLARAKKSGFPVLVGEWCAALPFADSAMTPEGRIALERIYTSGQLAAFGDCVAWCFQTFKTSGRLSSWDARVALASFEKGMLS